MEKKKGVYLMLKVGDKVKSLKTGEEGIILSIRTDKCKYPITVTFDKEKLKNKMVQEYEIVSCTREGWLDWRYRNSLDIVKIEEV